MVNIRDAEILAIGTFDIPNHQRVALLRLLCISGPSGIVVFEEPIDCDIKS